MSFVSSKKAKYHAKSTNNKKGETGRNGEKRAKNRR